MLRHHPALSHLSRRQWLRCSGALGLAATAACNTPLALAQPDATAPIVIAQIADMSALQQDISRDFLIGSRTAWQELNAKGGIKGRVVQHKVMETDGSASAIKTAWQSALDNPALIAFSGCVGDTAAAEVAKLQRVAGAGNNSTPNVAPWLHRQWADSDNSVFHIFPDYQAQIEHAVKSLAVMGVKRAGVVYATPLLQTNLAPSVALAAKSEGLSLSSLAINQRTPSPPAIVLFIGGTPELHAYANQMGVSKGSHCYLVAFGDVNLQVLTQLGGVPANISTVVTQPVPLVTAGLPVVRSYRTALGKLFDEPPSTHGLAGYIAARYTAEVLAGLSTPITRANALTAFRKRADSVIGGYAINFRGEKLGNANVTQSMLTSDGRIVG